MRTPPLVRLTTMAVVVLLLCGGTVAVTRSQPTAPRLLGPVAAAPPAAVAPGPVTPEPVPSGPGSRSGTAVPVAVPASTSTPTPAATALPPLDPVRAAVRVQVTATAEPAARALLAGLDGVVRIAAATVVPTTIGGVPADVAEVDVEAFRAFTPAATANHAPLWDRITAGDVAVTHEFAASHQVPLGSVVATGITGPTGDPVALRVGAQATNGTPPIADAIVGEGVLTGPGGTAVRGVRHLLVALDPQASPTATAEALTDAGLVAEVIPDPRIPRSDTVVPAGGITPENVWDHLAMCESSGDWHINTGNGYYGGVQFLPESWAAVGGQGLPHEHSREEQIHRATLLWQIQGWEAWPQCARKLGLIVDPPPQPTATPQPVTTEPA